MKLEMYQVDAFASKVFEGNPAAICPLQQWLDDDLMQQIAAENNLSETAFFVASDKAGKDFHLRWFTPAAEVKLCGHATLASAHVLFNELGFDKEHIVFETLSGDLVVKQGDSGLEMDFPAQALQPCDPPEDLLKGLGKRPTEVFKGEDYVAVFDTPEVIENLQPDLGILSRLDSRGICVTALASQSPTVDFVSRFFAPQHGINEDPVTGSSHCSLAPLWAERLGKTRLQAQQLSSRGGLIACLLQGNRVALSGQAVTFLRGEISLDPSP